MRRDQLNDEYLELLDKQRLYFKTVKDFKEVSRHLSVIEPGKSLINIKMSKTAVVPVWDPVVPLFIIEGGTRRNQLS